MKKPKKTYACEVCSFNTCNKTDYTRHLLTPKHKNMVKPKPKPKQKHICECSKEYATRGGLWKHKKKCLEHNKPESNLDEEIKTIILINKILAKILVNKKLKIHIESCIEKLNIICKNIENDNVKLQNEVDILEMKA